MEKDLWPPSSPDLNPLDFGLWGILQAKVGSKNYSSVKTLKLALLEAWKAIPQDQIRAMCTSFSKRVKAVVSAKGGHVEM